MIVIRVGNTYFSDEVKKPFGQNMILTDNGETVTTVVYPLVLSVEDMLAEAGAVVVKPAKDNQDCDISPEAARLFEMYREVRENMESCVIGREKGHWGILVDKDQKARRYQRYNVLAGKIDLVFRKAMQEK